ncbi:endonuclease III [Candidatus Margulisiibacteriota bacterium]
MEKPLKIFNILKENHPEYKKPFLKYTNNFELLVAVVLSAQCTDKAVNNITPNIFKKFPTPKDLSKSTLEEIKTKIKTINYYKTKAKNLKSIAQIICKKYSGKIPSNRKELMALPGIGRKSANVILGQVFNQPAITVDTHVKRLAQRIGFTSEKDPSKIEKDLMIIWPKELWFDYSSLLILHGRKICKALKPLCCKCIISEDCRFCVKTHPPKSPLSFGENYLEL